MYRNLFSFMLILKIIKLYSQRQCNKFEITTANFKIRLLIKGYGKYFCIISKLLPLH